MVLRTCLIYIHWKNTTTKTPSWSLHEVIRDTPSRGAKSLTRRVWDKFKTFLKPLAACPKNMEGSIHKMQRSNLQRHHFVLCSIGMDPAWLKIRYKSAEVVPPQKGCFWKNWSATGTGFMAELGERWPAWQSFMEGFQIPTWLPQDSQGLRKSLPSENQCWKVRLFCKGGGWKQACHGWIMSILRYFCKIRWDSFHFPLCFQHWITLWYSLMISMISIPQRNKSHY